MRTLRPGFVAAAALAAMALPSTQALGSEKQATHKDFDSRDFAADSTTIDNRFLPLVPGTQFVLDGTASGGVHRVIFTVTGVSKWVNHVRTLAVWDRDIQDGELAEEELAFFAQDESGNVWLMGEYPEEHEDGEVSAPSAWLAGLQDAVAGVAMRAHPRVKTSSYFQGIAPEVEFIDKARVAKVNQKTCVPADCYKGVLLVDEWDPTQQPEDGHQFKYHAPGVGVVRIEARGGEEQETLVLTKLRHLSDDDLAKANDRALELDQRARTLAHELWHGTAHAEVLGAP
jgi:hypothetical protein